MLYHNNLHSYIINNYNWEMHFLYTVFFYGFIIYIYVNQARKTFCVLNFINKTKSSFQQLRKST